MKQVLALSLVAGLFLWAGCLGPVTSGVSAECGRVTVENRAFASLVELGPDRTGFTDSGFLKAQVTVFNTSKRDLCAQYRFTWKDNNGMTLKNADTRWMPLTLYGREEAVIEAICPVPNAADFRLVLRPSEIP